MRAELIRIGNSRGIRIPKGLIEQCRLGDGVELSLENNRIVIFPSRVVRQGWEQAFQAAASGKDELLLEEISENDFDRDEWQW